MLIDVIQQISSIKLPLPCLLSQSSRSPEVTCNQRSMILDCFPASSALTWFMVRLLRRRTCTSPGNKTLQPHGEPAPPNYRGIFRTNRQQISHTMSRRLPINNLSLRPGASPNTPASLKLFLSSPYPAGRHRIGKKRKRCRPTLIAPITVQLGPCRVSRHTKKCPNSLWP
jgi:hypothetical protein